MKYDNNVSLQELTDAIINDYSLGRDIDRMQVYQQPDSEIVIDITNKLLTILFPGYYRERNYLSYSYNNRMSVLIEDVFYNLRSQIEIALPNSSEYEESDDETIKTKSDEICREYFRRIPMIREFVNTDIQATYDGDPAAYNKDEVVLSYPGLMASTVCRLAHELYLMKVPMVPRMMTEYAHSKTGIDIHPGATIGKYFFMDHGTGIVVGETSIIGEHVKIYQGVTIGALSTRGGHSMRGNKRHPTIEDDVTIYAGASILGGETTIGTGSVVGSNVFITSSIAPNTRISNKTQEYSIKRKGEKFQAEEVKTREDDVWIYTI